MTKPPLHAGLFSYLRSVQASDRVGLHQFFRHNTPYQRSARSVKRWRSDLGDKLLIAPNVLVNALGLRQAHLLVTKPGPAWLSFPYAIEAAWITPDFFAQDVLY